MQIIFHARPNPSLYNTPNTFGVLVTKLVLEWIRDNDTMLWALGAASVVTFVGTLIVVPWIVVRLPADYFSSERPPRLPPTRTRFRPTCRKRSS